MTEMTSQISFVEKYALIYYLPLLHLATAFFILSTTVNIQLLLAYVMFVLMIGYYIPLEDTENTDFSRDQNKRKWALIPLIVNCLSTPVTLYLLWHDYDQYVNSKTDGVLLCMAFSMICSTSIDASHQLLHRTQIYCKIFSYINLFCFQFTIYPIQHLYLHHKKVGTPQDPITASKDDNIFNYYVRAIVSAYKFNYKYDKTIFLGCVLSTLSYIGLVCYFCFEEGSGISKISFFVGFSYLGLFVMQSVQFIEHYGLVYRASDKAKQVTQICSWNTSKNMMGNALIFRFERHSDHHMNAYKLYNTLDLNKKMPQFPFDFLTAGTISTIPKLWKWIADPLVDEVIEGKAVDKNHLKNIEMVLHIYRGIFIANFIIRLIL